MKEDLRMTTTPTTTVNGQTPIAKGGPQQLPAPATPVHLRNPAPPANDKPATDKPPQPPKAPAKPEPKVVGKMEQIEIPVGHLLAALQCASKDESRYYLQGVFIHRTLDGFVRLAATDGARCLVANLYREHKDKPGPKWLSEGVIVPADGLAARVKLIDKAQKDLNIGVKIAYGINQPRIEVSDDMGINIFRLMPVNGMFPNYENVTTNRWSGVDVERGDWKPTGFNPTFLKSVADVAKALDSETVECFDYAGADGKSQPILFTFGPKVQGVALFLMPMQVQSKMGEANRLLLAPSIKLTLAALKAHETRNRDAAKELKAGPEKEAALAKADAFAARIKAVIEGHGTGQVQAALPAPKPPKAEKPTKAKVRVAGHFLVKGGDKAKPKKVAAKKAAAKKKA
jgi:hypothetical protein